MKMMNVSAEGNFSEMMNFSSAGNFSEMMNAFEAGNFSDPFGLLNYSMSSLDNDTGVPGPDSKYFVLPHRDPELAKCTNIMLRSELEVLTNVKFWLNGVVTIIVALFGLAGNSVSVFVLLQPKMRNSFNQLLIALCVFDTLFICCSALIAGPALGIKNGILSGVRQPLDVFAHVFLCASVLSIVAFTFERHFAICNPHKYRIHIMTTPAWKHISMYLVPVTLLSFFFNIPMFMNLQRSWMANPLYVKINLWLRVIHPLTTTGLAPILILVVLNVRICKGIMLLHQRRNNRNAKEINMTYIAIAIVGLFFVFNTPRLIAGSHEVLHTRLIIRCVENEVQYLPSLTFFKWDAVARLLMLVNSSVNFLVYCVGSTAFQEVFAQRLLHPACRPRSTEQETEEEDLELDFEMTEARNTARTPTSRTRNNSKNGGTLATVVITEAEAADEKSVADAVSDRDRTTNGAQGSKVEVRKKNCATTAQANQGEDRVYVVSSVQDKPEHPQQQPKKSSSFFTRLRAMLQPNGTGNSPTATSATTETLLQHDSRAADKV